VINIRKYAPIWLELKTKLKVAVAAPPPMHERIIKGVMKEKDKDLGFKLMASEENRWYKIEYTKNQSKLTFVLKNKRIGLKDL